MTRTSMFRRRVSYGSRATALLAVLVLASGCSPYIYQKEVALFDKGVDDAIASFEELTQINHERLVAQRNENLKKLPSNNPTTQGCDELRKKYEAGFKAEARNVLTEADYATCKVLPAGVPSVDPALANLTAMGVELKRYAAALGAVTSAEDATALQSAFTEFNGSVAGLLETVNERLAEKNKPKFNAISGLVYQAGILLLNQKRFNALKKAVNDTHLVVKSAAEFMAEAAHDVNGPVLSAQLDRMGSLQLEAANKAGDDYVRAWLALNAWRDAYIDFYRKNPVGVFHKLVDAHEALRQSVNDPGNLDQVQAVLANAKTFQTSAKAALEALKKPREP